MSNEVNTFKLMTGEEVICQFTEDEDTYTFRKPRVLMLSPAGNGQMSMALLPYMSSCPDADVVIKKVAIASFPVLTEKSLEKGYLEQTSGIALS